MKMTFQEILLNYSISCDSENRWRKFHNNTTYHCDMLKPWLPLLEYTYSELIKHIESMEDSVDFIFRKDTIEKIIYIDLNAIINTRAIRCLVLELNFARKENKLKGETSEDRFQDFINQISKPECQIEFMKKFPELERILLLSINQYIETTKELLLRLFSDYYQIKQVFWNDLKDTSIELINMVMMSEVHRQGRSVRMLEFETPKKKLFLLYKPRSIQIDLSYLDFIELMNEELELKLKRFICLGKQEYGWLEYISHNLVCRNLVEVENYYKRLGYLLAIIYVLAGTDIHLENVIAHGEHPIIIDLECLLTPIFGSGYLAEEDIYRRLLVFDSYLLPKQQMATKDYSGYDMSAFSGMGGELAPQKKLEVVNPGTDLMTIARKESYMSKESNVPKLKNKPVNPLDYQNCFKEGFIEAYHVLLKKLNLSKPHHAILNIFKDREIRVVLRSTAIYSKLLSESYHPILLQNEEKRRQYFNWLVPKYENSFHAAIVNSEIEDLMDENIPIFTCKTTENEILDGLGRIVNLKVFKNGYQRIYDFIEEILSPEDLKLQKLCIDQSMLSYSANQSKRFCEEAGRVHLTTNYGSTNSTEQNRNIEYLKTSKKMLDLLIQYHIEDGNFIYWTTVEYSNSNVWQPERVSLDLYSGLSGIMLCFAYAGIIFKNDTYMNFSKKIYKSITATIRNISGIEGLASGALLGVGGIIYSLSCLSRLWNDNTVLQDTEKLIKICEQLLNKNPKELDVMSGGSGLLAVLEVCNPQLNNENFQKITELCVQNILENHSNLGEFIQDPGTPIARSLPGFAYGILGVAWSLFKYFQRTKEPKVKQWIQQALAFERGFCFDIKHNSSNLKNKKIYKKYTEESNYLNEWCHGSVGIGLAKLDMQAEGWLDRHITQEVLTAIKTAEDGFDEVLNLCRGSIGRIEFLLYASQKGFYSYEKVNQHALSYAYYINSSDELSFEKIGTVFMPGLFTGAAGIAYEYMRLAYPDFVPSILLLYGPNVENVTDIPESHHQFEIMT